MIFRNVREDLVNKKTPQNREAEEGEIFSGQVGLIFTDKKSPAMIGMKIRKPSSLFISTRLWIRGLVVSEKSFLKTIELTIQMTVDAEASRNRNKCK